MMVEILRDHSSDNGRMVELYKIENLYYVRCGVEKNNTLCIHDELWTKDYDKALEKYQSWVRDNEEQNG